MSIHVDHNGVQVHDMAVVSGESVIEGHRYLISAGNEQTTIQFQNGPVKEKGVNGITSEALLAILIHRTKILDENFGCDENRRAIQHLEEALVNFEVRTARRMVRGVEGKNLA